MNRQAIEALRDELDHPHGVGCDRTGEERLLMLVRALLEEDPDLRAYIAQQEEEVARSVAQIQRAAESARLLANGSP